MIHDRLWLFGIVLVVAGLLIYALSPLLDLFLVVLREGMNLFLAMPQIVWWLIGITIMIVWGFHLLAQFGKRLFPTRPQPQPVPQFHGRMGKLRSSLCKARWETYSQDKVRQHLSSLAIDLISLRLDISEEEARKLYFRGDWTDDEIVKAYFYKERPHVKKRRLLPRWFKKSERPLFLKETSQVLNCLGHYSREG
jgi:hypothetical protein